MSRLRSSLVTVSIASCALWAAVAPSIADSGEAGKTPAAILADIKRDLSQVKSFHYTGRTTTKSTTIRMSGEVFASGAASIALVEGKTSVSMILLSRASYLKANAAYWRASGGADGKLLASKLAGRWVKVPASAASSFRPLLKMLTPKYMASCISSGIGTLSNNGVQTLEGRKAIVIEDKGDKPGAAPGLLYVAAEGPVLPLRVTQTGPAKAGGKVDRRCGDEDDKSTASAFTFSRFDRVPRLKAPRRVLSLDDPGTTA